MAKKRQAPFQGSFKASRLPLGVGVVSIATILFCYVVAQLQGSEPPFPNASITNNSNHYPQYIVFRVAEEGSALFIIFIWFIEYFWLKQKAEETGVTLIFPEIQPILGFIGGILFILSTATIDTGTMNGHLHQQCATWFFILIMVNFLFNFISFVQFKCKKESVIDENSFYIKLLINMLDIVLVSLESSNIPHYNNIQEYLGVFFMCIYMGTFTLDWKGYYIEFNIQNPKLFSLVREEPTQLMYGYVLPQQPQIYYAPSIQQQVQQPQQKVQYLPTVHTSSPMGQALAAALPAVQQPVLNIQGQPIYHAQQATAVYAQQYPHHY